MEWISGNWESEFICPYGNKNYDLFCSKRNIFLKVIAGLNISQNRPAGKRGKKDAGYIRESECT